MRKGQTLWKMGCDPLPPTEIYLIEIFRFFQLTSFLVVEAVAAGRVQAVQQLRLPVTTPTDRQIDR